MLNLPERTNYNKRIPKNKFYKEIGADKKLESKFINEVDYIVWKHKISEETTNIESTDDVQEIQVFEIYLKTKDLSKEVLENIDRVVPYPILYLLRYEDKMKVTIAYKERSKVDVNRMVVNSYYGTDWINSEDFNVDILSGLTINDVYENIVRQLMPLQGRLEDDIKVIIVLNEKVEKVKREIAKLEKKIISEKQFSKKVEINRELQKKQKELKSLTNKEDLIYG